MTDITELAQSLKAAAEKASGGDWVKESGDGWDATCSNDDQANSGFIIAHFVGPDSEANREFVQLANPANVKQLVEALEKAQTKNALVAGGIEAAAKLHECIAELEDAEQKLCAANVTLDARAELAERQLAEMGSRTFTTAATDVLAERQRQITAEGWTPEHDDEYQHCEMAVAAACYIMADDDPRADVPELWPWPSEWWKPTDVRRDLVKAGALILAEIERLDRAAGIKWEAE